jgi:hypothetical protein
MLTEEQVTTTETNSPSVSVGISTGSSLSSAQTATHSDILFTFFICKIFWGPDEEKIEDTILDE